MIGAGDRGYDAYATYLLDEPAAGTIVGVAEPDPVRRARFAERYGLEAPACHETWKDLLAGPRVADYAIVATGDAHHVEPTLAALAAGYHVLLEKPIALDEGDCLRLHEAAERADRVLAICHVYRYSHLFSKLHEVVESGVLGDVVSIQQSENVSYWHYAHSYVRGLTRRSEVPWLLQKSCHDLDLISWLAGAPPALVSSFLRPTELTEANAPVGAPDFCIDGCPHAATCPYDAVALYRDLQPMLGELAMAAPPTGLAGRLARRARPVAARLDLDAVNRRVAWWRWPVSAVTDDHTPEGLDHALRTSRWGRCAYKVGDNDQPSSQSVSIQFTNGVNATFMLQSNSYRSMRYVRVDGTRGTAIGHLYALGGDLMVADHVSGRRRRIRIPASFDGHGGGERPLFVDFLDSIRTGREPRSSIRHSLDSHRIAFAAMRSARDGVVVDLRSGAAPI
ncbi:MAG: Oxidoreductase family, C-terminal alpha/beta domain/Oxidoreductase family, NAD-binding Rossmann fold [Acidimicrobiales bacterium]|nr:Oxidoreductase family, C-terminal alpha/beta domain/Oxidoreductase family, NAD-binding Rossmann fold [Acidimicrobiales bacterium]